MGDFDFITAGFVGTPTMDDIRRLEDRIEQLDQQLRAVEMWIKGFEAGKGATEVLRLP